MDLVEPDGQDFATDSALVSVTGRCKHLITVNFALIAFRAFDSSSVVYCAGALLFFRVARFVLCGESLNLIF